MGLKIENISFNNIRKENSFRFDVDFLTFNSKRTSDNSITFSELFDIVEKEKVDIEALEVFQYAEITDVAKTGDVFPNYLNVNVRDETNESYFKKIEKGDIILPKENDILLSSVRPNLKKFVLVEVDNEIYFTKAFIHLRPKQFSEILYYTLREIFFENLIVVSRQGKGYPTLKVNDLKCIRFDRDVIENLNSKKGEIIPLIKKINEEIKTLKKQMKQDTEIINDVFAKAFNLNLNEISSVKQEFVYNQKFSQLSVSKDFRSAVKFNSSKYNFLKLPIFNEYKIGEFTNFMTLGRQITPEDFEEENDYYYLLPNCIKNFYLEEDLLRPISDTFYNTYKHIALKRNDIVLAASGEGTIGKSAIFNSDKDCVLSQFTMKIELNEKIDLNYFHYYLQSIFFQLTVEKFKKGMGNMTNIFVSQVTKFPILYNPTDQREIVSKIKTEIQKQREFDKKIKEKKEKINRLINDAIN